MNKLMAAIMFLAIWLYFFDYASYILYLILPSIVILFIFSWTWGEIEKDYKKKAIALTLNLLDSRITFSIRIPGFQWSQNLLAENNILKRYKVKPQKFYSFNPFKKSLRVKRYIEKNSYIISLEWIFIWYRVQTETYSHLFDRYEITNNCYVYEISMKDNNMYKNNKFTEYLEELNQSTGNKYILFQYWNKIYLKRNLKSSIFDEYESGKIKKLKTWPTLIPSLKEVLSIYYDTREVLVFIDKVQNTK